MKKITTATGTYGPYDTVEVLADRYVVNHSAHLPFTVIGQGVIADVIVGDFPAPVYVAPVEEAPESPTKEQLLLQLNAIQAQIQALA